MWKIKDLPLQKPAKAEPQKRKGALCNMFGMGRMTTLGDAHRILSSLISRVVWISP